MKNVWIGCGGVCGCWCGGVGVCVGDVYCVVWLCVVCVGVWIGGWGVLRAGREVSISRFVF